MTNRNGMHILTSMVFAMLAGMTPIAGAAVAVTTSDGSSYQGELVNPSVLLEWRRDIYEIRGGNGSAERFILKPPLTGSVRISDIREIRPVMPGTGPESVVTLTDGQTARLMLKYLLIMQNGKSSYISDFITMDPFTIEIRTPEGIRKIYLSTLRSITLVQQEPVRIGTKKPVQPTTMASKPAALPEIEQVTFKTQMELVRETSGYPGILKFFIILSALLMAGLVMLIIVWNLKKRARGKTAHKGQDRKSSSTSKKSRKKR